jgi:hypothetical protein
MGSAVSVKKSSKLLKPGDCSQENWTKILQLFDRLDSDGTQTIEASELMGNIANLHVVNNINRLEDNKKTFFTNLEFEKKIINVNLEINIQRLRKEAENSLMYMDISQEKHASTTDASIKSLNEMTMEEKSEKIRTVICGNKTSIEFVDFYNYMKSRTQDFPNIIW